MLVNIDKTKIIELLKDFNAVTRLRVGLFGLDREEIASFPQEFSNFCNLVKQNEKGKLLCSECDNYAFNECERLKGLYIYKCHMGLSEAVFPIAYEGVIIAYMMFGQVFEGKKNKSELKKKSLLLDGIDEDKLNSAFFALQEMPHNRIDAIAKMMEVYASYISFSDYIYTYIGGTAPLIKSFIEQNIEKSLVIEMIANRFNIGRTTACIKFKEGFGLTINQFITKTRLEKAKMLLRNTTLSATQISEECGYCDYNYFIRIFKKNIGKTPFEYRNLKKS